MIPKCYEVFTAAYKRNMMKDKVCREIFSPHSSDEEWRSSQQQSQIDLEEALKNWRGVKKNEE